MKASQHIYGARTGLALFLTLVLGACSSVDELAPTASTQSTFEIRTKALKDLTTGLAQACTPVTGDENCNAEGPGGQKLFCGADNVCYSTSSDSGCTYPEIGGGTKTCIYTACTVDNDCLLANPDPNLTAVCTYTVQSSKSDEGGECRWYYKDCEVLKGTPCHADGVNVCADNVCTCSAKANTGAAAKGELCDGVDNTCDGKTDEGFPLGDTCDGDDTDVCKNGTFQCASSGLTTKCVNETATNIAEACNAKDDDCDGKTDEDFPTLTAACDGDDADVCKNGAVVCSNDQKGVACQEVNKNVDEACNGLDDDCDASTDEGCDDDKDGYCDASMSYFLSATGPACKAGDCNDAEKAVYKDAPETCNSVDDDCDGATDEGFSLGDECFQGIGVCAVKGTFSKCAVDGKSAVCSSIADLSKSVTETCDGFDNDCDSKTDEDCDNDKDGYCNASMTFVPSASGPVCKQTDCNDNVASIFQGATETCNNVDDNCDGAVDEGCDDDKDGYCDASMSTGADALCKSSAGKGTDCDDTKANVHPDIEEVCATAFDDNCDGKTDVKADLKTPVCDACASVKKVTCGKEFTIDMGVEANAFNAINSYTCWSDLGVAKSLKTVFDAPEVMLEPDAPVGTKFSLVATDSGGKAVIMARLHGSCKPNAGTKAVTAYNAEAGVKDGTCAKYGAGVATSTAPKSVSGGVVGADVMSVDAQSAAKVTLKFTCIAP